MKKSLLSCESLCKQLICENSNLKKDLADIKSLLLNFATDHSKTSDYLCPTTATAPGKPATFASVVQSRKVVIINPKTPNNADASRKLLNENLNPNDFKIFDIKQT